MNGNYLAPAPLDQHHKLDDFCSGVKSLDNWLKFKARKNEKARASRTCVLCTDNHDVIGYYALAAGSIASEMVPGKIRRNMPDPIPVMVLGRLAVDHRHQSNGFGDGLLKDAILRVLQASEIVGIKAIIVHALSERAKQYYIERSFIESPGNPMTLILPLRALQSL